MDNKDEKEIDQEGEDDEDLEPVEMMGNRTSFEEASETIRSRGFIKGLRL